MNITSCLWACGLSALLALSACSEDKQKSLSELKDEQTSAINAFKQKHHLRVVELKTNSLPRLIDKGVYYRFKNGLYLRVLEAGDSNQAAEVGKTTVFAVFKGHQFTKESEKTTAFDNLSQADSPELEFKYIEYYNAGEVHYNLVANSRPIVGFDSFMCEGLAFPLSLSGIGNGAKLSLIIPFEIGPNASYSKGASTYVEEIRYTFK